MSKLLELAGSRKFWIAVFTAIVSVWGYFEGEITAEVALGAIVVVVGFWQQAQSRVDAARVRG